MSYFLFGKIELNLDCENKSLVADFAWKISKLAMENHLYAILSPLIPQRIVCDMIEEQCGPRGRALDFLLTSSPIADTSDELFSPDVNIADELKHVAKNLQSIHKWIRTFLTSNEVDSVQLLITEGYDCDFLRMTTNADNMLEALRNQISDEDIYSGFIPSLHIRVCS